MNLILWAMLWPGYFSELPLRQRTRRLERDGPMRLSELPLRQRTGPQRARRPR